MILNQAVSDKLSKHLLATVFVEAPGSPLYRKVFVDFLVNCIVGRWNDNYCPVVATVMSVHTPETETFLRFDGQELHIDTHPLGQHSRTQYECGDWGHQFSVGKLPQADYIDVCGVQVVIAQEGVR